MIAALVNNMYNKKASFVVFLDTYYFIYLTFAVDHLVHPILCVRYSEIFKSGVINLTSNIRIKTFNVIVWSFFGVKIDQETNQSTDQRLSAPQIMTISSEINHMNKIFQQRQRTVVQHHLDPENQNELLNSIWSNEVIKELTSPPLSTINGSLSKDK
uniref:Uncharacterized protein n=1 Tax=Romanomermis culicivorax TaxID=13658 RepID=A0A915HFD5_ROMCU